MCRRTPNNLAIQPCFFILEDNDAVIKMIITGRSPTMSYVSRTHRVALDRTNLDQTNLDPMILGCLGFSCSPFVPRIDEVKSKRQMQGGEEPSRVVAKSRPVRNLAALSLTSRHTMKVTAWAPLHFALVNLWHCYHMWVRAPVHLARRNP